MFRCNVCKSNAINVLDTDMFQIFDIDYSFEIDKKIIENNYKEMIKSSHPDVNENIDIEVPTHVIRNYKLLNDPFERALLIISKKMNTSRERLIDEIDSLPVNLKVMDDVFDKDMKIKEIETGDMKKYNLTSIIESNNAKINQYIESLKVEFRKESLEVVKILKILKELRIYQKLNVKLSGI
ncbi:DNAJ domain containing protein [Cryptosporidium ryanae]|uniref:DNAJ domain containing protein n=1 Tax=Cryptosporidium ryanae TaxID=515981 RepID=UPI00351A77E5|nr:DNAJ domain containing protein [Cryptosporidium ryanae]